MWIEISVTRYNPGIRTEIFEVAVNFMWRHLLTNSPTSIFQDKARKLTSGDVSSPQWETRRKHAGKPRVAPSIDEFPLIYSLSTVLWPKFVLLTTYGAALDFITTSSFSNCIFSLLNFAEIRTAPTNGISRRINVVAQLFRMFFHLRRDTNLDPKLCYVRNKNKHFCAKRRFIDSLTHTQYAANITTKKYLL